ncbi:serine hydrolase family protein [Stappia sp. F7233]|uniref:Serine hydrolase family protein n=1 Tax=Stappia albiluteola TaxID=2758565 RepID=A0A839AD37_9HYPH|nr:alpha/beta hydrolase [Stappia albiluteola]MBA5777680.1 serine hydrolase family protein [Stappia albiluteola]
MKVADADILIVPGWQNSGPDHWQSRWMEKMSTARRVEQDDWENPDLDRWVDRLVETVEGATRPVVLVAHSLGVPTVVQASGRLARRVRAAFLVSCPDVEDETRVPAMLRHFGPLPLDPLPFHSWQVASRTDPYCEFERAERWSRHWGTKLLDAGDAGHLNTESGQGPWPEGVLAFAHFMKEL